MGIFKEFVRAFFAGKEFFYCPFIIFWILLGSLSIAFADPNNPCQNTSVDLSIYASTWLLTYGITSLVFALLTCCPLCLTVAHRDNGYIDGTMVCFDNMCSIAFFIAYFVFYIIWLILGVIVFFSGTLGCQGKSRMFSIMLVDLSFMLFYFVRSLIAVNVSVSPGISKEQVELLSNSIKTINNGGNGGKGGKISPTPEQISAIGII